MTNLHVGDAFPDFELPDHRTRPRRLSAYTMIVAVLGAPDHGCHKTGLLAM